MFTERAERLIVGVAAQAGIAIDNARLYEAAQKAAEERKALLESERAARTAAERMSDMKDEFLATLSHELRTPLNAILGWSQVLRTRRRRTQADYLKGLETIERNARVQTQLIEDLLDMSRITSGQAAPRHPAAAAGVVHRGRGRNRADPRPTPRASGSRSCSIRRPGRSPAIRAGCSRSSGTCCPTPSSSRRRTARSRSLLERVNSHIEISVADTGVGIKPEFLPHLFERFRQGDASTTRKYGGLGLGLSIVKNLVELHGGTVGVKSPGEGQGTTVTVQLPLTAVHRDAGHAASACIRRRRARAPASFVAAELAGLKVLVVDDQADARELIKRVLRGLRGGGDHRRHGRRGAARSSKRSKPDVLVSDIGMPDADGFELLRRVRALGPERGGKRARDRADRVRALRGSDARAARRLSGPRLEAGRSVRAGRDRRERREALESPIEARLHSLLTN